MKMKCSRFPKRAHSTLSTIFLCLTEGDFEFYDNEPLPEDLLLIEVELTNVIMEGIYRIDELARYRTLVPSERYTGTQCRMDIVAQTR